MLEPLELAQRPGKATYQGELFHRQVPHLASVRGLLPKLEPLDQVRARVLLPELVLALLPELVLALLPELAQELERLRGLVRE